MDVFKAEADLDEFITLITTAEQETSPEQILNSNKPKVPRKRKANAKTNKCTVCVVNRKCCCKKRERSEIVAEEDKVEDKNYFCVTCSKQFGNKDLAYHTSQKCKPKINKKEVECRICSKVVPNRQAYEKHWDDCHQNVHRKEMFDNSIRCRICPRYFKNRLGYQQHLMFMHLDQLEKLGLTKETIINYLCPKCGFLASDEVHLKKHAEEDHKDPKKVHQNMPPSPSSSTPAKAGYKFCRRQTKCRLCRKLFSCSAYYEQHWISCHKNVDRKKMYENTINCIFCYKCFSSLNGYSVHLGYKHDNEVKQFSRNVKEFCKFMCSMCGQRASDKLALQAHIEDIHRDAKPKQLNRAKIPCRMCSKSFYPLLHYERHWKKYHASTLAQDMHDNPICCYFCRTYFLSFHSYKCHLEKSHADQLSLVAFGNMRARCLCRTCGIFSKTKSSLKSHAYSVHGIYLSIDKNTNNFTKNGEESVIANNQNNETVCSATATMDGQKNVDVVLNEMKVEEQS